MEKKGLKSSVTENDKEEKSKIIASCGVLENELSQFSKEEGVTLADRLETLGMDLRTRVKRLGAKEKASGKKCNVMFSIIKKSKAFQKNYMKVGVKKLLRAGMMPARTWACSRIRSRGKDKIEETDGSCSWHKEHNLAVFVHGCMRP